MKLRDKLAIAAADLRVAGDRQLAAEAQWAGRSTGAWRAGELVALPASADWPLQWLLLDDASAATEVAVVPADPCPVLGPEDLAVEERSTASPLSLRCGLAVRLPAAALRSAVRVGELTRRDLAAARGQVGAGRRSGGDDPEPAYADWLEDVVLPARAAVAAATAHSVPPAPTAAGPWRAAAGILLALSVVLAGSLWQARRSGAPAEGAPLELPLVILAPQDERGDDPMVVTLGEGNPRFAVVLSLDPVTLRDSYRLEAWRPGEDLAFWTVPDVGRNRQPWLSLELPSARFPPGEYRLAVLAPGESGVPLAEYRFRVEAAGSRQRQSP